MFLVLIKFSLVFISQKVEILFLVPTIM